MLKLGRLEAMAYSEPFEELLFRSRPLCRRCGRKVGNVQTRLAPDEDALQVWFHCHGMSLMLPIARSSAARLNDVWPRHVFEYEATSFGSWDANGAPV